MAIVDLTSALKRNFCYNRSREHDLNWMLGSLIVALPCFAYGFYLYKEESFTWFNSLLFAVGAIAWGKLLVCLLTVMNPERGKLGKSLRPYYEGCITTDILSLFAVIDKDIAENGQQFDYVWVGKEWVVGGEAMRIDRIRGIFTFEICIGIDQNELEICLVDRDQNIQVTSLGVERRLDALYDYLKYLVPRAETGGFKDYSIFIAKNKNEMEMFNEWFLEPEEHFITQDRYDEYSYLEIRDDWENRTEEMHN